MTTQKISDWLSKTPTIVFVILSLSSHIVWWALLNAVIHVFSIDVGYITEPPKVNTAFEYISAIIIIPMVETLLSQKLPYWGLTKISYLKQNIWIVFLISATLFALLHFYSVAYIIYTFVVGLILIYSYHVRIKRHPFWTITLIHSLFNTFFTVYKLLS
ncbi:CPBP family intramembrane glutamic endopeptidase [Porphyromonas sp.]|uniref:CPBP family intramembrane glutamic endopeptidase n=1 Tax=Porphyromonas sp. TaxID=1924944 RepID=UPI0026DAD006|nr:CPBP family intramembrane glutamic endopeptidase [Porphyromonas sp.]MDO4771581.1 CPBP family intramembrane metalloprotease [Porphyromonas sp.]